MSASVRRDELEEILESFVCGHSFEDRQLAIDRFNEAFTRKSGTLLSYMKSYLFPVPLYKYTKFDKDGYWKEYFEGKLYMSSPAKWNDLSDSLCIYSDDVDYSEHSEKIRVAFQNNQCATCFSERNDNMPMWCHYSEYNTGFVIGYNLLKLKSPQNLMPVVYNDNIKFNIQLINEYTIDDSILLPPFPMLVKSKQWEYEQEWRLIGGRDNDAIVCGLLGMKPTIMSVYFGVKADKADISKALKLIDDNYRLEKKPQLYKMQMDKTKNVLYAQELSKI